MTVLKNKIRRIRELVTLIENVQNLSPENQTSQESQPNKNEPDNSELLLLQMNFDENEFLFI